MRKRVALTPNTQKGVGFLFVVERNGVGSAKRRASFKLGNVDPEGRVASSSPRSARTRTSEPHRDVQLSSANQRETILAHHGSEERRT